MRRWIILLLLALVLPLSGCGFSGIELKDRLIVQAIGVDYQDGNYHVSLQVFDPDDGGGGAQGAFDASKPNNQVYEATGKTMADTFRQISLQTGKTVFLGNYQLIVLGEDAVQKELNGVISFFSGSHETRPKTIILACDGKAKDIVGLQLEQGIVPSDAMERMVGLAQEAGLTPYSTLMEVARAANSLGETPLLAYVGSEEKENGEGQLQILGGAAPIKDGDTLYFSQLEIRGAEWILGEVEQTTMVLEEGDNRYTAVVQPVYHQLRPKLEGGQLIFTLRLDVVCSIPEAIYTQQTEMEFSHIPLLTQLIEKEIEQEADMAFRHAQQDGPTDVFRFSKYLDRYLPEYWKSQQDSWPQEMSNLQMEWDIRVDIKSLGLTAKNRIESK